MIYRLYDWDDTLALSRKALYLSYKEALRPHGLHFTFDYFNEMIYDDATKFLRDSSFSDEEIAVIKKAKEQFYIEKYANEIILKLPEFVEGDKYYIVTNTNADLVRRILEQKIGTTKPWVRIIGTYDGIKRKPEPDLYDYAFKLFKSDWNNNEDELHIYEDSIAGILAAANFLASHEKRINNFTIHHIKHDNPFKQLDND